MYNAKYNVCPQYIKDIFKLDTVVDLTMCSEILVTSLFLDTTKQLTGMWSKLSRKDVKNAESIHSFKKKIRKVDLEQVITAGRKNCFLCCMYINDIF